MPATCSSCHAPILWARTAMGRAIPIDPEPVAGGNLALRDGSPPLALYLTAGEPVPAKTYRTHFASCPNGARHRKAR